VDLEPLLVARGDADDEVVQQAARQAVEGLVAALVVGPFTTTAPDSSRSTVIGSITVCDRVPLAP
jgi:hypothetical protein